MVRASGTIVRPVALEAAVRRIFEAAGTPSDIAATVAESLVLSNRCGVDSHGCIRVPQYLEGIESGRIDPCARPTVRQSSVITQLEGNRGFGQFAAHEMVRQSTSVALEYGASVSSLAGVMHIGRLGEYVQLAAERGLLAIMACNGGPAGGSVAPFGGRGRALGTNPLAFSIPRANGNPIVGDFSTSATAEGKLRVRLHSGDSVPEGWLIDSSGRPSADPADFYSGGAILPAGGHRGFALGLLVEVLGGVLAGEGCACLGDDPGNGVVLIAVDVRCFDRQEGFEKQVDRVVKAVCAVPPILGIERVMVPGEPEAIKYSQRTIEGIPFAKQTWESIVSSAQSVGVVLDEEELGVDDSMGL